MTYILYFHPILPSLNYLMYSLGLLGLLSYTCVHALIISRMIVTMWSKKKKKRKKQKKRQAFKEQWNNQETQETYSFELLINRRNLTLTTLIIQNVLQLAFILQCSWLLDYCPHNEHKTYSFYPNPSSLIPSLCTPPYLLTHICSCYSIFWI